MTDVVSQNGFHWVERTITRRGKTHKQWYRVKDPNAPKPARRKKAEKEPELDDAQAAEVLKRAGVKVKRDKGDPTITESCKSVFGRALTETELLGLTAAKEWQAQYPGDQYYGVMSFTKGGVRYSASGQDPRAREANSEMSRQWTTGERLGDPPYAYHDTFFVGKAVQGKGFGRSVLKSQLAVYQQLGLDHVRTDAIEIGKYYWPKLGFQAENFESHKKQFEEYLARPKAQTGQGLSKEVAARVVSQITSSRELVTAEIDGKRVGKEWATGPWGSGGYMTLDLKPGSKGLAIAKRELAF